MSFDLGRTSSRSHRFLVALVLTAVALVVVALLRSYGGTTTLSPIVAAVALACWYGGTGPGILTAGAGWLTSWFVYADGDTGVPPRDDLAQFFAALAVSVIVIALAWALRRLESRTADRADVAERELRGTASMQLLMRELSTAVTPSDVAHTLVVHVPELIGASGAALGLIEADRDLRIVDPIGAPRQTLSPGALLPLETRAPITTAARTGEVAIAADRTVFEREYPDGAELASYADGALAVPLHVAGAVIGAMGFPFNVPNAIDAGTVAIAELAASLGGQALERAGLYEQERSSRELLERIGSVAPRFGLSTPESVGASICQEAREVFEADAARIWNRDDGRTASVVWDDPPSPPANRRAETVREASHSVHDVMQRAEPLFFEAGNPAGGGVTSTLLVPMLLEGAAGHVLELQWRRRVEEPSATMLLVSRFADQAELALEHAERRIAEDAARRQARETGRLLDVTAALAAANDAASVVEAAVKQAMKALGASAGGLVRVRGESLELVGVHGYPEAVITTWGTFGLDTARPLADAIRRNELVVIGTSAELRDRFPAFVAVAGDYESWLAAPLTSGARVVGGLALSFEKPRGFDAGDRAFVLALSRQAGVALEHALLLEDERDARLRAERMAGELARLHALSTSLGQALQAVDVAATIVELLVSADGTHTAGLYVLDGPSGELALLFVGGRLGREELGLRETLSIDASNPLTDVLRSGKPVWLPGDGLPGRRWLGERSPGGEGAAGIIPLAVKEGTIGVLFALSDGSRIPEPEQQRFVETVARQATLPLERVRLLEDERIARERAELLQGLTAALSGALTRDDVVEILLAHAATAVGATGAGVVTVDQRTGRFDEHGWRTRNMTLPQAWAGSDTEAVVAPLRETLTELRSRYLDRETLSTVSPEAAELAGADGEGMVAVVPLLADRTPIAIAVLAWEAAAPRSHAEQAFVDSVASKLGQALDRALRYEAERTIAETLQRSVLPETLSSMEGATVAARYLPGSAAVDVGGDWFDTIHLPDGRLGFVVGDVVGKGVQAASTMARLRNGMRALTLDSSDPSVVLSKVNRMLDETDAAAFATSAFVAIDPITHETTMASAGHLPPLVIPHEGDPALIDGPRGVPLGVNDDTTYPLFPFQLAPGSILVLYTDGLVERRDRPLDAGLELLLETARAAPGDPDGVIDHLLDRLVGEDALQDDVAVLVVRLDTVQLAAYSVRLPSQRDSLVELRTSLGRWLEQAAIPTADRRDLILATWEASANAIEHAREPSEPSIAVSAKLAGDRVRVEVSDTGAWREERTRVDRGLGLGLIRELVTTVAVEKTDNGTTVVMERVLTREPARRRNGGAGNDLRR